MLLTAVRKLETVGSAFDLQGTGKRAKVWLSDINNNKYKQCLLSFGAESFVFQVAIQKFKD
jgi:hypothetical protein